MASSTTLAADSTRAKEHVPVLLPIQRKHVTAGLLCALILMEMHNTANARSDWQATPELSGQQQAIDKLLGELLAVRSKISNATAALGQLDILGPQTNEISERLAELKATGPEKIESFRVRLRKGTEKKNTEIMADHAKASASLAQDQANLDAAWIANHPRKQKYFKSLVEQGPLTKSLEADLVKAEKNLESIELEKSVVIAELKAGHFCSECLRSKHEIEKGSETFLEHIKRVGGHVIMAPGEIQKRETAFDNRIRDARNDKDRLATRIKDTAAKYEKEVASSRKELADMELEYESRSSRNKADKAHATELLTRKTAELAQEKKDIDAQILSKEQELNKSIQKLGQEIADRQGKFDTKRNALTSSLAALKMQEAALAAKADAASSKYTAAYKTARDDSYRSTVVQDTVKRQAVQQARGNWETSQREFTAAQERYARNRADASPTAVNPEAIAIKKAKAEQDRQTYQKTYSSAVEPLQTESTQRSGTLTTRATTFLRSLPEDVQEKIRKNVETFGSPLNTARAVIRHSISAFESSIANALINRAQGRDSSLAEELAAATEAASPSLASTIKANVMPTIEDVAVEMAVAARSIQEQKEFSLQEATAERGFARTRLFGTNLKKHFDGLLRTYDETIDNATTLLKDPE